MNIRTISRILGRTVTTTLFFLLLVLNPSVTKAQDKLGDPVLGEKLFKMNCGSCHMIDSDMTGPALGGVTERHSVEWIKTWVRGPKKLIDSGDKEANKLAKEWESKSGIMTAFNLKDEEIGAILQYINEWEPPVEEKAASNDGVEGPKQDDNTFTLILGVILVVLIMIVIGLILVSTMVKKALAQKDGLDENDKEFVGQTHSVIAVVKHPAFIAIVVLVVGLVGAVVGIRQGLFSIGVQQAYAPEQPIAFSHKIHAGEHEIDCNYCHTGVRKAKHANIPSPNICMNCHSSIKTDSPEIQKIYDAIDYDPKTRTYGDNVKPIQWVRIHNLPDLVYYNHQQHVKVGGLECQTCHGPIEEMDVVYKYSELTMGWCIDCHRKTDVQAKGNAYYDDLLKQHEESGSKEAMKVEDIGGLECSKCHY